MFAPLSEVVCEVAVPDDCLTQTDGGHGELFSLENFLHLLRLQAGLAGDHNPSFQQKYFQLFIKYLELFVPWPSRNDI